MTSHHPDATPGAQPHPHSPHPHPQVLAFDLDGTLAESKTPITPRMADLLTRLLTKTQVCIISGGAFPQFQSQVLDHLDADPAQLTRLNLMPTNGTRYYLYRDAAWREIYAENLPEETKRKVITVLTEGAKSLGLWESDTWGDIVEDRGSQITFSALGQQAPVAAKTAWDPDGSKKEQLRAYAAERLPGLEVRSGGSTSIDVTAEGIDKAHGMRKLMAELHVGLDDIVFVGDRLDPQGNDHPVEAMGIRSVPVKGWQDTAEFVEQWLEGSATAIEE